jgi:DNA modification methylase
MTGQIVVPTYEDEANGIRLYRGDCLEVMKHLPIVDMVLTDPPYGTTQNKWDSVVPLDEMWVRIDSISNDTTPTVLTAAQPFTSSLVMSNVRKFKYDWVWRKPKGTGHLNAKKQPMRDKEDVLVFYNKQATYNPQMTKGSAYKNKAGKNHNDSSSMSENYGAYTNFRNDNSGLRYPKQVQEFPVVERGSKHPTQKPVALMEYLIKTYTNEGDTVLDFTMGSGTTGVACVNTGRKFIGIELDEGYFEIARNRIEEQISSNDTR